MAESTSTSSAEEYARPTAYGGDTSPQAVAARLGSTTEAAYATAAKATRVTAGKRT